MNRRTVLASAIGGVTPLAGCVGVTVTSDGTPTEPDDGAPATGAVRLATESEYIVGVRLDHGLLFDSLLVDLASDPPTALSAVVLVIDGEQEAHEEVTTGETTVGFEAPNLAHEVFAAGTELLPVRGGGIDGCCSGWRGGEVLERVQVVGPDGD